MKRIGSFLESGRNQHLHTYAEKQIENEEKEIEKNHFHLFNQLPDDMASQILSETFKLKSIYKKGDYFKEYYRNKYKPRKNLQSSKIDNLCNHILNLQIVCKKWNESKIFEKSCNYFLQNNERQILVHGFDNSETRIFLEKFGKNIKQIFLRGGFKVKLSLIFTPEGILTQIAKNCKNLQKIYLDDYIDYNNVNTFFQPGHFVTPNLNVKKIKFSDSPIKFEPKFAQLLDQLFPSLKKIQVDNLGENLDFSCYFKNLTNIRLKSEGNVTEETQVDCIFMKPNLPMDMQTLKLDWSELSAEELNRIIQNFSNLKKIYIEPDDSEVPQILNGLTALPTTLEDLCVKNVEATSKFLNLVASNCRNLRSLKITGFNYNLPYLISKELANVLSSCTQLKILSLAGHPEVIKAFEQSDTLDSLEFLDLSNTLFEDNDVIKVVSKCPNLISSNIRYTKITVLGLSLFSEIASHYCPNLTTVYFTKQSTINLDDIETFNEIETLNEDGGSKLKLIPVDLHMKYW